MGTRFIIGPQNTRNLDKIHEIMALTTGRPRKVIHGRRETSEVRHPMAAADQRKVSQPQCGEGDPHWALWSPQWGSQTREFREVKAARIAKAECQRGEGGIHFCPAVNEGWGPVHPVSRLGWGLLLLWLPSGHHCAFSFFASVVCYYLVPHAGPVGTEGFLYLLHPLPGLSPHLYPLLEDCCGVFLC